MKRKVFGIITAMLFVLGAFFYSGNAQLMDEKISIQVKNIEALAGSGDCDDDVFVCQSDEEEAQEDWDQNCDPDLSDGRILTYPC